MKILLSGTMNRIPRKYIGLSLSNGIDSLLFSLDYIDSSHSVKIGGDVNYLFLDILPRLAPGVLVHIFKGLRG
jgi:hypothetical protein